MKGGKEFYVQGATVPIDNASIMGAPGAGIDGSGSRKNDLPRMSKRHLKQDRQGKFRDAMIKFEPKSQGGGVFQLSGY